VSIRKQRLDARTVTRAQMNRTGSKLFYGYWVVGLAFLVLVVMWGVFYSFGVFFTPLLKEFGWTRAMTAGAFSLASIMSGLLAVAAGKLTDRYGPRLVLRLCGVLLCLGYVLMPRIQAVWQLYLFYGIVVGTGMAGAFVPLMSTVARWFTERRSTMTGIVTAGVGIGALTGPPVANRLIFAYGWRASYLVMGIVSLVFVLLCAHFMRRDPAQVGLVAYGEDAQEEGRLEVDGDSLSVTAAIRLKQFWMVFGMFFCLGFCVYGIMVHMAPHATEMGISAESAANILATVGGVSIFGKVLFGRAADGIGSRKTFMVGCILMGISLLWLLSGGTQWILFSFAGLFGLAYGGCVASQSPLVASLFGLHAHGLILGCLSLGFTSGGALGPFLTGYLFDLHGSYRIAFLVCAVLSFVGLVLTLTLPPEHRGRFAK